MHFQVLELPDLTEHLPSASALQYYWTLTPEPPDLAERCTFPILPEHDSGTFEQVKGL